MLKVTLTLRPFFTNFFLSCVDAVLHFSSIFSLLKYFAIPLVGYCLGSFPTAYLAIRWKIHQDIRLLGSGNVGALNCYLVTGSKLLGLVVFVIDVGKGVVALLIVEHLFAGDFWTLAICGLAAVGGHNFPLWLRFQGGRGLATSSGLMLMLGWPIMLLWALLWLIAYLKTRDILLGNGWATLITPILLAITPSTAVQAGLGQHAPVPDIVIFIALLSVLVLTRHVGAIIEILRERRNQRAEAS